MSKKESVDGVIGGVPETMLVPLYARAIETGRDDGMVNDPLAVEMVACIDYDFSRFAEAHMSNLGVAIRTEIFDELTARFIEQHPDAVIVNIAAGLDTRFSRVDNGRVLWYDLDLPESIAVREKFITPSERQRNIAHSALEFSWMDEIEKREHVLFIVEGLLMYFDEAEVRALLLALTGRFPGAEALIEVIGVSQAANTRSDAVQQTAAAFRWGIRYSADLAAWDDRLMVLEDVSIYDRYADRWEGLNLDWGRASEIPWSERLEVLRNTVDRIVHLRFGA